MVGLSHAKRRRIRHTGEKEKIMIHTPAVRLVTKDATYVVYPTSTSTYRVERYSGLELVDIWEAESFTGLGEVMDFLTLEDEDWNAVFQSIEG